MKKKCLKCGKITEVIPVSRLVTIEIDDKKFHIQTNGYACPECGHFFFDKEKAISMAYFVKQKVIASKSNQKEDLCVEY